MTAKQTPLVDLLRIHADDIHSAHGHNKSSTLLSQAADRIAALEAERDQLLNEIQLITAPHDSVGAVIAGIRAERDQLRAELATCQQDAERYRWLRGTVPESSSRWARWRLECWISGAWHELRGLHLDTCIDAARKGEGEQAVDLHTRRSNCRPRGEGGYMRGMTVTHWHKGNKLRSYFGDAASQELYHEFQILRNGAGQIIASFDPQRVLGIEDHNEPLAAKGE